jgi:hypothetical protein
MIYLSADRRVHHYVLSGSLDEYQYIAADTIIDDRQAFEEWWSRQARDEGSKETAYAAWRESLEGAF